MEIEAVLQQINQLFKQHLHKNVVGIYLHGSIAMDCFHPSKSDIDLLVVVSDPLSFSTKQLIIQELVALTPIYPGKGLEMSIVLKKDTIQPTYPMPFELHFGQEWGERFLQDPQDICACGEDPDLAAHITVLLARGKCLYGAPITEVFSPVPESHFFTSLWEDVKDSEIAILKDPVYTILNLCRTLLYIREGKVASKKEGGEWGIQQLVGSQQSLVQAALTAYKNGVEISPQKPKHLTEFARELLLKIKHEKDE